jgi:hypothetical protein
MTNQALKEANQSLLYASSVEFWHIVMHPMPIANELLARGDRRS